MGSTDDLEKHAGIYINATSYIGIFVVSRAYVTVVSQAYTKVRPQRLNSQKHFHFMRVSVALWTLLWLLCKKNSNVSLLVFQVTAVCTSKKRHSFSSSHVQKKQNKKCKKTLDALFYKMCIIPLFNSTSGNCTQDLWKSQGRLYKYGEGKVDVSERSLQLIIH